MNGVIATPTGMTSASRVRISQTSRAAPVARAMRIAKAVTATAPGTHRTA